MKASPSRPYARGRRLVSVSSAALLFAATLSGCASGPNRCLPADLEASPTVVRAGESLIVASAAADCDLGYVEDTTYSIVLISSSGERSEDAELPVSEDGRFSGELLVPDSFPSGTASVVVTASTYDDCDDGSGSCAGYSTDIAVID